MAHAPILRNEPRLSVNQLARLMTARPAQRDTIIRQAREAEPPLLIYYEDATRSTARYVVDRDRDRLRRSIADILAAGATSDWHEIRRESQVAALRHVGCTDIPSNLNGLPAELGHPRPPHLAIQGVTLSVRPEVILRWERAGKIYRGGVKLMFSKGDRPGELAMQVVAAAVNLYLATHGTGKPSPTRCYAFDVFGETFVPAPRSSVRLQSDVASVCREVALKWHEV